MSSNSQSVSVPEEQQRTFWPDASLIGVAVIWGINIPLMKNGLDELNAYVFNGIRLIVSVLVLTSFAIRDRRLGHRPAADLSIRSVLTYAVIVSGLYQLLFLMGVARTTSGNTALILATIPMWTAILARVFIGERLASQAWVGLAIALAGTVVVATQKGDISAARQHLIGNLLILGAALCWSIGTVYSRPLLTKISPIQLSAFSAMTALPFHLLLAAGSFQESMPLLASADLWLIIIYSGALSTGLALPMWSYGVRHAGPSHAGVIQNLVPVVAIAAAWLSRGEPVTTAQVIGGVLIISGLVTMRRAKKKKAVGT